MRRLFSAILVLGVFLVQPNLTSAEELHKSEHLPIAQTESSAINYSLAAILATYQTLNSDHLINFGNESGNDVLQFVYVSREKAIVNNRVDPSVIGMLGKRAVDAISENNTQTDVCYVQKIHFTSGEELTVGVHNFVSDRLEDVYRCFAVTLWFHSFGYIDGVDTGDWRTSIKRLFDLNK